MIKELQTDHLKTLIFNTRDEMGKAAAADAATKIRLLQQQKGLINIIFAAAPSQNETLKFLVERENVDWQKIRAFHMDEYLGLPANSEKSFSAFLDKSIFSKVKPKEIYYIGCSDSGENLCAAYEKLLRTYPPDIIFMGIGENGHIAFNDPHVADFEDKELIKIVELDEACRIQQVNDKCFAQLSDVPTHAVTLTIPALMRAKYIICSVPSQTKARAVWSTVNSKISTHCPSTILRLHSDAVMYTDADSAYKLLA